MTDTPVIPEAEFATTPVIAVDSVAIERIRQAAHASQRRRARLCLHSDFSNPLHNMVIVLLRGTQVAIHRHPNKPECYHVLSGEITLLLFDEQGQHPQRIPLGVFGSGRSPICRIAAGVWHSVEVESDEVILHESTVGPFSPTDTEYWTEAAT